MKKLIFVLISALVLTGCGAKDENNFENVGILMTNDASKNDMSDASIMENEKVNNDLENVDIIWNTSEKGNEEFKSIVTDYIVSLFYESYSDTNKIISFEFSNAVKKEYDEDNVALEFDFKFKYIPINQQNEEVLDLKLVAETETENGHINPFEMKCYSISEKNDSREIIPICDAILQPNTYFGEIEFKNGRIELDRKIWVAETGGYTPNGYFAVDTDMVYVFDIAENCTIEYIENTNSVVETNVQDFIKKYDDDEYDRLFHVKVENDKVINIIEQYIP